MTLRIVELTGEPGDMVFRHPAMAHCVSPNRGAAPRFMRIRRQRLTRRGRRPGKARTAIAPNIVFGNSTFRLMTLPAILGFRWRRKGVAPGAPGHSWRRMV